MLGIAELVDFPDWGVSGVRGKVDTGAKTSALHVSNIHELPAGHVGFDVRLHRKRADRIVHVEAKVLRRGRVRSSSGHIQQRIFVKARIRIGPLERDVELGLVDRDQMIFRMLIGRAALSPDVLVDPSRRYVATTRKRKKR